MALHRLYAFLACVIGTSLCFNFVSTSKLFAVSATSRSLEAEDPLAYELSTQLLHQRCHALETADDCQASGSASAVCHWCVHGGVPSTNTNPNAAAVDFSCVPLDNPCREAPVQRSHVQPISEETAIDEAYEDTALPAEQYFLTDDEGQIQAMDGEDEYDEAGIREAGREEEDVDVVVGEEQARPDTPVLRRRQTGKRRRKKNAKRRGPPAKKDREGPNPARLRNQARHANRTAEYLALSEEERDALVFTPYHKFYRARYYAPVVSHEFKLVFVPIPKVACTQWLQLFRRLAGQEKWRERKGGLPYTPDNNGLTYLSDYSVVEANNILTSPEWTRAVFVRDPKERLLSAYLDKVVNSQHIVLGACCRKTWDCASANTTFEEFVDLTDTCTNEHWDVQSGRLPKHLWQHIDFVGKMDDLEVDAEKLLRQVGAWEDYGSSGWGPDGAHAMFADEAGASAARRHATKANERMRHYYTPILERRVAARFRMDYSNPLFDLARRRIFPR
jgi:hypothetical protein